MSSNVIDRPAKADEDRLNMKAYGNALAQFIENAQSPLTIALQGEWGSGKTSLMNKLYDSLVGSSGVSPETKGKPFLGVWINTWQFALMSDPEEAILKILLGIIGQVSEVSQTPQDVRTDLFRKVFSVGKSIAKQVLAKQTGVDVDKTLESWGACSNGRSDVESLKNDLATLLNAALKKHPEKRGFLFFIDDLDRIDPPVAVQILELLKNIFDLEHCIFVLAIDYGVVVKGLKPKFGEMTDANEREFRSFFDKIIQLPFAMPVGAYQINDFLLDSLKDIGYLTTDERTDQELSKALTFYALESVGTNPRSLKRLINTLSLIWLIVNQTPSTDDDIQLGKWKDVIFALVCIQIQYPQVYAALERHPDFSMWDDNFRQEMRLRSLTDDERAKLASNSEFFDEPWEQMVYSLCEKDIYLSSKAMNVSRILNAIKKRFEDKGESVHDMVESLLHFSAVTSVKSQPVQAVEIPTFNRSEYLKTLRDCLFGMKWTDDGREALLADDVLIESSQSRVQTNLTCGLWSTDATTQHRLDGLGGAAFTIYHNGRNFVLKMWGEAWGYESSAKQYDGIDYTEPDANAVAAEIREDFKRIWASMSNAANIGHHDHNAWYNVTVDFPAIEDLKSGNFADRYRKCMIDTARAFKKIMPYRKEKK